MTEYKADLVVSGYSFDPLIITTGTGIEPSYSYNRGEPILSRNDAFRSHSIWVLSSHIEPEAALEDHLVHLLDKISPEFLSIIKRIDSSCFFNCSVYSDSEFGVDVHIDNVLARRIAENEMDLRISFCAVSYNR